LDITSALATIYKLPRPGGILGFVEPNMLNTQIAIQKNISWIKRKIGDLPDEPLFLRWNIHNLFYHAGFVDVQITLFDWLHPLRLLS
jgi:hypothetical protein